MSLIIKSVVMFSLLASIAFLPPKHNIVGHWKIFVPEGVNVQEYVDLRKDGTYNVYVNDKAEERGFYTLKDSVFSIKNAKPVCGDGYWGKYKIEFYGSDSLHFTLIEDTCNDRRMDIVGFNPVLRRIKAK